MASRTDGGSCVSEINSGTCQRPETIVAQNKMVQTVAGGPGVPRRLWLRPHGAGTLSKLLWNFPKLWNVEKIKGKLK